MPSRTSPHFEHSVAKEEATAKAFDQLANAGKDPDLEAEFAQLGATRWMPSSKL